jgi:hypothetical protein
MPDPDPDAERPAPIRRQSAGNGCLWLLLLTPVVIVIGLVVGSLAAGRGDDGPTEASVRIAQGSAGGQEWRVEAVRDVDDEVCAFLYVDGEQLTGACGPVPQDATLTDTTTIVFGKAPDGAERVRVGLSDGRDLEIDTVGAGEVDGRFYVEEVEGDADLDVTGDIEPLPAGRQDP